MGDVVFLGADFPIAVRFPRMPLGAGVMAWTMARAAGLEPGDLLLAAGEALRPTPADVIASTKVVIPAPTSSERPAALAAA